MDMQNIAFSSHVSLAVSAAKVQELWLNLYHLHLSSRISDLEPVSKAIRAKIRLSRVYLANGAPREARGKED
jgi:arginine decarboxylase-like protein